MGNNHSNVANTAQTFGSKGDSRLSPTGSLCEPFLFLDILKNCGTLTFIMDIYIYGKHAVLEALEAGMLARALVAPGRKDADLEKRLRAGGAKIAPLEPSKLPREIDKEAVHQGVVGVISSLKLVADYKDFIQKLEVTPDTSLVIFGEVQDPHNVGAVIRSAAAFGVSGVLIPEHNQAQVTGAVIKVSAGMAFKVPLVSIGNVNTIARDLKEKGFWVYGLAGEAEQNLDTEVFDRPTVFIVGNEGEGLREKTREVCDVLLKIPMHSRCESLNVSVSTAVALQAWSRQHGGALR